MKFVGLGLVVLTLVMEVVFGWGQQETERKVFTNTAFGYSVSYPKDWQVSSVDYRAFPNAQVAREVSIAAGDNKSGIVIGVDKQLAESLGYKRKYFFTRGGRNYVISEYGQTNGEVDRIRQSWKWL